MHDNANLAIFQMKFPTFSEKLLQRLGLTEDRNAYWSWARSKNFGDWITPYLFFRRTGTYPLYFAGAHQPRFLPPIATVWGAGSIMRKITVPDCARVWGSGIIFENDQFAKPKEVLAVRGPRTAARLEELGYRTTETYGDPGLLLAEVYRPVVEKRHEIGIIPHIIDLEEVKAAIVGIPGLFVIDVGRPIEGVVDDIVSCEATISSSLHGIIVSHAYGVPSVWWATIRALIGDNVKFIDYFESVGLFGASPSVLAADAPKLAFRELLEQATLPDTSGLKAGLIDTCPFWWRK